jgi:hypothetical protein
VTPRASRLAIAHDGDTSGIRLSIGLALSDPPLAGRGGPSGEGGMR